MGKHSFTCHLGYIDACVSWLGEVRGARAFTVRVSFGAGGVLSQPFEHSQTFASADDVLDHLEVVAASNELLDALSPDQSNAVSGTKRVAKSAGKLRRLKPS